tara:strand:- start:42 stop:758 length:717 start_codon:yes stop_codon:yes gene_type:complete
MVEYLQTKKGYFYKFKKNGEKKRISRKEYNKKNKTRKNKKMFGGGRTEQEIIEELKTKGKYDEWVSLGSKFGLTSNTLRARFFLDRPYMYYDVDGKLVNVSMVQNTYRPDVDNIAVFKQHYVKDPTHVDQSKYRIVNSSEELSTAGLATCTGLAMIIGTKKFMTHLDANTPIGPIISAIDEIIATEGIVADSLKPIIYAGSLDSSLTLEKAKEICSKVGIPETNYNIEYVCMKRKVRI